MRTKTDYGNVVRFFCVQSPSSPFTQGGRGGGGGIPHPTNNSTQNTANAVFCFLKGLTFLFAYGKIRLRHNLIKQLLGRILFW